MVAVAVLAACGGDDKPFCVESELAITQGVYGQVVDVVDTPPFGTNPLHDHVGLVITRAGVQVASPTTDAHGVFQVVLDPGDFRICDSGACADFTVAANALVRVNEGFGVEHDIGVDPAPAPCTP